VCGGFAAEHHSGRRCRSTAAAASAQQRQRSRRQPNLSVKTKLDESGNVENDQQALMPDPTALQNSVTSTADTSAHADGGVRSNISVMTGLLTNRKCILGTQN